MRDSVLRSHDDDAAGFVFGFFFLASQRDVGVLCASGVSGGSVTFFRLGPIAIGRHPPRAKEQVGPGLDHVF
jgi:hypothetical protein